MNPLIVISLILTLSFLLKEIFKRINIPEIVAQISVGIILAVPIIKNILFSPESLNILNFFSDLGILFLLFLAGYEINYKKIIECAKDSIFIALFSSLLSFFLGFSLIYFIFSSYVESLGFNPFIVGIVFGISLAVTAEGTSVKVLIDMGLMKKRIAAIILGAGVIDNVLEIIGLSIVLLMFQGKNEIIFFPLHLVIFCLFSFFMFSVVSKLLRYVERKETDVELYMLTLIVLFIITGISYLLNIGYLIGAIVAGFMFQYLTKMKKRKSRKEKIEEEEVHEVTKLITLSFLAPIFFAKIGFSIDFSSLFFNISLLLLTIFIATIGKIVGTLLTKPFSDLNVKELYTIGWAMNSRGAVELVIAILAFSTNIIPASIFSILVITSIVTTMTMPISLQFLVNKYRNILK